MEGPGTAEGSATVYIYNCNELSKGDLHHSFAKS
jgi:hypothetical protein